MDRRYFKVRELTYEGEITVEHIETKDNPADVLTKSLPLDSFSRHSRALRGAREGDQFALPRPSRSEGGVNATQ